MANYRFSDSTVSLNEWTEGRATLSQRVYNTVREEIVTGVLRPGDRLVRRNLASRLGVSPMPVTEALLRLEVDGLVESQPLYGSRVRPMTIEDLRNDQILREAIECQVARMCAENATDAQLSALLADARPLDRMLAQSNPHPTLSVRMHLEFHLRLACCCGSPRIAEELERVWFRQLMRINTIKAIRYRRVPKKWHEQLVEAIASHTVQRAEDKMREHIHYGNEVDQIALDDYQKQQSSSEDNA